MLFQAMLSNASVDVENWLVIVPFSQTDLAKTILPGH